MTESIPARNKNFNFIALMMEMLGTWGLVYFGGLLYHNYHQKNVLLNMTGLAFFNGIVYMCWIYMALHISGAHFNPVVSLALVITGHIGIKKMFLYWIAQLLGSFLAGLLF